MLSSASDDHPKLSGSSPGVLRPFFMKQPPMLAMGIDPPVTGRGDDSQRSGSFHDAQGGIFIPRFDARGNSAARGDLDFQGPGSGGTGNTLAVMA